jgi:hypothetical protein
MTPLPKNKITSVERGKRRHGNTPNLKRNVKKAKIPAYKNKIVQKLKLAIKPVKKADESKQRAELAAKMATKRPKKIKSKEN